MTGRSLAVVATRIALASALIALVSAVSAVIDAGCVLVRLAAIAVCCGRDSSAMARSWWSVLRNVGDVLTVVHSSSASVP